MVFWTHNLNPVFLELGPLEIRYYGIVYVLGFFFSVFWLQYWRKQGELKLSSDEIWDFTFYCMIGVIIGARLFMVFWDPEIYLKNPLELFMLWNGGMSFHGALVGIVTAGLIYCKKKKIPFFKMADLLSVPTMFALALGRVANFINGELVGRTTKMWWCMEFPPHDGCRHPSTLYAATKRFLITGWLTFLSFTSLRKRFSPGFIFWNFVFWDGLGRIIVDIWREDPYLLGITLGQWFSVIMVAIALCFFWRNHRQDWKSFIN